MKQAFPILALVCYAGLMSAGHAQETPGGSATGMWRFESIDPDSDWTRHFRVGGMAALNISGSFRMNGSFNISGSDPAAGIYDDGYVRVDDTGDAGGYTSYWGYNSASQLSGSTLTMHSATSFTTSGGADRGGSPYPGFDLAYGDSYWYLGRAKLGWEFGLGILPVRIADNQTMSATVTRSVYTFDTGGIVVPTAPYNGGPSGIGPTIPDGRTQLTDDSVSGTVTGTRAIDGMLYTARLGPTLYWNLSRRIGLYAGGGPAVGLISGELKYDETVLLSDGSSAGNHGHISGTKLIYGGYVNATVVYHAVEGGDFYLGAQYMPLGNATISGGGREGTLKLGGQVYIMAGINWPF